MPFVPRDSTARDDLRRRQRRERDHRRRSAAARARRTRRPSSISRCRPSPPTTRRCVDGIRDRIGASGANRRAEPAEPRAAARIWPAHSLARAAGRAARGGRHDDHGHQPADVAGRAGRRPDVPGGALSAVVFVVGRLPSERRRLRDDRRPRSSARSTASSRIPAPQASCPQMSDVNVRDCARTGSGEALEEPLPGVPAQDLLAPHSAARVAGRPGIRRALRHAAGLLLVFPIDDRAHVVLTVRAGRACGTAARSRCRAASSSRAKRSSRRRCAKRTRRSASRPTGVAILGALTPLDIPVSGFRLHPVVAARGRAAGAASGRRRSGAHPRGRRRRRCSTRARRVVARHEPRRRAPARSRAFHVARRRRSGARRRWCWPSSSRCSAGKDRICDRAVTAVRARSARIETAIAA